MASLFNDNLIHKFSFILRLVRRPKFQTTAATATNIIIHYRLIETGGRQNKKKQKHNHKKYHKHPTFQQSLLYNEDIR